MTRKVQQPWPCMFVAMLMSLAAISTSAECIDVNIDPAEPDGLHAGTMRETTATRDGDFLLLENGYLRARISSQTGLIESVTNHLTGETYRLADDICAVRFTHAGRTVEWKASRTLQRADLQPGSVIFEEAIDGATIRMVYTLAANEFWLRRQLIVDSGGNEITLDRIDYGRAETGAKARSLQLGAFDRPQIIAMGKGGLFAGIEHWFYRIDENGAFHNAGMNWGSRGTFEGEPFFIGVFVNEPNEPYAGWAWYKSYLERARLAAVKHAAWFTWNAGWGQWGIDIDDPSLERYLERVATLGINGVILGSGGFGRGIDVYTELAASNPIARANLQILKQSKLAGGTLNNGQKNWGDSLAQAKLMDELDAHVQSGYGATAFDFFACPDTYSAHRDVANYFRAARQQLAYTECHLGMAAYGPQFQRFVQVNHPDDIAGFDIGHFSADWATFLAFRQSRRNWQKKYEYLMPENGLYYYVTHYSNWGNPRRYTDPEPQQMIWRVPAYCGIGFNFHDPFGWRESIAAASAFTTAPVFGHLDLKMPQRDAAFAREFLRWIRDNADLLGRARVCAEADAFCIVSKIAGGKGLIYVLNYLPGQRQFNLTLRTGSEAPLSIRQVYPSVTDVEIERKHEPNTGGSSVPLNGSTERQASPFVQFTVSVRGESCAILEVNDALRSLPPTNAGRFPIDLSHWRRNDNGWIATFNMPDVREALRSAVDPSLPARLLSLDQVQDVRPDLLTKIPKDKMTTLTSAVQWIGKGKLPAPFRNLYGFREDDTVETEKLVPWAFADRVWLVIRPARPLPMIGEHPRLLINNRPVEFAPRVDHRFDRVEQWTCPLYVADVTEAVRFAANNEVQIRKLSDEPIGYITSAADRR